MQYYCQQPRQNTTDQYSLSLMDYRLNSIPEYITDLRVGDNAQSIENQVIQIQMDQPYSQLPRAVNITKVILKVSQSLRNSASRRKYFEQYCKNQSMDEKFQRYLNLFENKAIICDCFWYILCRFFKEDDESSSILERRMSENYINLMLSIQDKIDNELFFREYFDLISQSVYYCLTLAYPKQIQKFNEDFRLNLLKTISKLFSGIDISKPSIYLDKWIIAHNPNSSQNQTSMAANRSLPPIRFSKTINKRQETSLRYSPIVELYLSTYKYKTKNSIPQFKMKYSKLPVNNRKQKQLQLLSFKNESSRIFEQWKVNFKKDQESQKKFEEEIRLIEKQMHLFNIETDKKKEDEISKGSHQYANKLTAEINSKPATKMNLKLTPKMNFKIAPKVKLGVIRKAEEV